MGKGRPFKICFIGAPSCGKTTLVDMCAKEFDAPKLIEGLREYFIEHKMMPPYNAEVFIEIFRLLAYKENQALSKSPKMLIYDGNALNPYIYCKINGEDNKTLGDLARQSFAKMDLLFFCDTIPFEKDAVRPNEEMCKKVSEGMKEYMEQNKITYTLLNGSPKERLDIVKSIIAAKGKGELFE
jgi:nicotinamide riboside kinase